MRNAKTTPPTEHQQSLVNKRRSTPTDPKFEVGETVYFICSTGLHWTCKRLIKKAVILERRWEKVFGNCRWVYLPDDKEVKGNWNLEENVFTNKRDAEFHCINLLIEEAKARRNWGMEHIENADKYLTLAEKRLVAYQKKYA